MKKIILITLIALFSSSNFVNAQAEPEIPQKQEIKDSKFQSLTGDYSLLSYKVKISLNKENRLILTIPVISEAMEKFHNIILRDQPALVEQYGGTGIFPHQGDFDLVPVSDSIFIIKFSNGYSIEIKKTDSVISKDLVVRNQNFDVVDEQSFKQVIASFEKSYSEYEKIQYRARTLSIKSNMHTVQTIAETCGAYWDGNYPDSLASLKKEAESQSYWKNIKNPYTNKTGLGKEGSVVDLKQYNSFKLSPELGGLVVYEALNCKYDKEMKKNTCSSYKIYGTDETGKFMEDNGEVFSLTNN